MAPGPNMMMIVPIGDWEAGLIGAIGVGGVFRTDRDTRLRRRAPVEAVGAWPWRNSIQQGLAPVSIGLLLAGCFTMAKGAITGHETAAIAVAALLILLRYKINPALVVMAGTVRVADARCKISLRSDRPYLCF